MSPSAISGKLGAACVRKLQETAYTEARDAGPMAMKLMKSTFCEQSHDVRLQTHLYGAACRVEDLRVGQQPSVGGSSARRSNAESTEKARWEACERNRGAEGSL